MATTAADVVGREDELAAIARFLEAEGRPCAVVVEGEPGIGKTTVWRAAVEQAAEVGFRVLRARPAESEARLAFSSLADLLEEPVAEVLDDLPEPQRRALEAALLLDDAGGRVDRRSVGTGLLSTLRALAARSPVLIAVDDLQWLDRSSATALGFALRRLGEEPVALLLSRRREAGDLEQALPPERILRVAVGPLGFMELNALLGKRVDATLSRPLLRRIHELSGGNPFFALELAQSPERVAAGTLPPTLDALVGERLATLPDETQLALLATAAASHPTEALVVGVVGAADALAPAEEAGIVELDHGEVSFTHPLLASGAYALSLIHI